MRKNIGQYGIEKALSVLKVAGVAPDAPIVDVVDALEDWALDIAAFSYDEALEWAEDMAGDVVAGAARRSHPVRKDMGDRTRPWATGIFA